MDAEQKLNEISSVIQDSVEDHCQCGFVPDRITDEAFQCIDSTPEAVVYVATIHGTTSINSSQLISRIIEQWATDGATVTILHEVLNVSRVDPSSTFMGECCTEVTMPTEVTTNSGSLESSLNETQHEDNKDNNNSIVLFIIVGVGSGGGVVIIGIIMIVVIVVIMKCRHRKRGKLR